MTDSKIEDYKKRNRVIEGPGRWNFKGVYTQSAEPTQEQKNWNYIKH